MAFRAGGAYSEPMKYLISCLALFVLALGCSGQEAPAASAFKVVDIKPVAASKMIKERAAECIILDIRTPGEFKAGHIKGAINRDYRNANFAAELGKLDTKKPVLMHCASGGRSTAALKVFKEAGFKKVYHLKAGFNGWKRAKLPVAR